MGQIVTLTDGREIEFPDGMSREDMQAAIQRLLDGTAQVQSSPTMGTEVGAIGAGMQRTAATMLGGPVDIANWFLDTVPNAATALPYAMAGVEQPDLGVGSDYPIGGSESIMDALEAANQGIHRATMPDTIVDALEGRSGDNTLIGRQPETSGGRVVGRIGDELTGMLMGMGVGGVAGRAGASALADVLLESPKIQTGVSTMAGGGAGVANEAFGESPVTDIAGALLGGSVGAIGLPLAARAMTDAANTGRNIVSSMTPGGRENMVANTVQSLATDPGAAAGNIRNHLNQTLDQGPMVPGSRPMTADVAQDPGLSTLSRVTGMDPQSPLLGVVSGVDAANDQARRDFLHQMGVPVDPDLSGAALREAFDDAYARQRGVTGAAYQAIDGDLRVPNDAFVQGAQAIMGRYLGPGTAGPPSRLSALVDDFARLAKPINPDDPNSLRELSYEVLQNMRSNADQIAQNAGGLMNPDRRVEAAAGGIRDMIDDVLRAEVPGYSEAQAVRAYQGQTFERGPGARPFGMRAYGEPRVPDERIPDRILQSPEATRQYSQAVGLNPQAQEAIRNHLVTRLEGMVDTGRPMSLNDVTRFWNNFGRSVGEMAQSGMLTGEQADILRRVSIDIAQAARARTMGMGPNSATYQNLTMAQALALHSGGLLPDAIESGIIGRTLRSVFGDEQSKVRELLADALTNPETMQMLLEKALPNDPAQFPNVLARIADRLVNTAAITGATGTALQAQEQ